MESNDYIDLEHSLIKYFVNKKDLTINDKYFSGNRKILFNILKDYFLKNDEFPNKNTLKKIVQDKELENDLVISYTESGIAEDYNKDYLLEKLKEETLIRKIQYGINKFNESSNKNEAYQNFVSLLLDDDVLEMTIKKGYLWEMVEQRWEEFKKQESGENNKTKKFHIDCLDKYLLGRSDNQFICFVSLPGVGKTNMMLNMAYNLARFEDEHVLFVSGELDYNQIALRIDARESMIDSLLIKAGNLNPDLRLKFKQALKKQYKRKDNLYVVESEEGFTTEDVIGWGLDYKRKFKIFPRSIYIDYMWLMSTRRKYSGEHDKLGNIAMELRHKVARKYQISVVSATQESRGGALKKAEGKERDMESVGESNKISPHVNTMIFLDIYKPEDVENMNKMGLKCVKNTFGVPYWKEKLFYAREVSYVGDEVLPGMSVKIKKKENKQEKQEVENLNIEDL